MNTGQFLEIFELIFDDSSFSYKLDRYYGGAHVPISYMIKMGYFCNNKKIKRSLILTKNWKIACKTMLTNMELA